jgi:hypothetical protein
MTDYNSIFSVRNNTQTDKGVGETIGGHASGVTSRKDGAVVHEAMTSTINDENGAVRKAGTDPSHCVRLRQSLRSELIVRASC